MIKTIMILAIALAFVAGSIATGTIAYAQVDDDDDATTLEAACLDAEDIELFFCQAIFALQNTLEELTFTQTDPAESVLEIQLAPGATAPPIVVTDDTGLNNVFTVFPDGSIQIGFNTVIINPDGTVTGGPLFLQAGSTVDGQLISTGAHTVDTLQGLTCVAAQVARSNGAIPGVWSCSFDITAVNAGTGLTGGGTAGGVTLNVDTGTTANKIVQLDGLARLPAVDGSQLTNLPGGSGTVTSVATGTGLTGGPIITTGTVSIDTAVVPQLGAANTFTSTQTFEASSPAIIIKASPAQVTNLMEFQDSTSTVLTFVGPAGSISAPLFFDTDNFTPLGTDATAVGGKSNRASGTESTVAGGVFNEATELRSTVGGGNNHDAFGTYATVSGGQTNRINLGSDFATISGGAFNEIGPIPADYATIGGGIGNDATNIYTTIAGGRLNVVSGNSASVGGGLSNTASGFASTVPGGRDNVASQSYSFATGLKAKAIHFGAKVFSDGNNFDFSSTTSNQFKVRATGGVNFVTAIDAAGLATQFFEITPTGQVKITGDTPGVGKILTSDAVGLATWENPPAGDNLGNHLATQDLDMAVNDVVNVDNLSFQAGGANIFLFDTNTKYKIGMDSSSPFDIFVSADTVAQPGSSFAIRDGSGVLSTQTKFSVNFATGNVGIGGVVPTTQLDVDGQVRIRGGSPAVDKVLASDANGLATWKDVTTITGAHTTDTNAGTLCATGQLLDGDGNCIPIPSSSSTSKYALVFNAADGVIPVGGGLRHIGQGNVYTTSAQATFIVPFASTVTNLAALQANGNADTTTTYTLRNIVGNTVVLSCNMTGSLSCSTAGAVDVNPGFPLVIEAQATCAAGATCPANIQFARVAIGLQEK